MFSTSLVALFSLVAVVVAIPSDPNEMHGIQRRAASRKCGSEPSLDVVGEKEKAFASILSQNSGAASPSEGPFTVQVNFNVIYASQDVSDGYVS
jgi:hypothetical protein